MKLQLALDSLSLEEALDLMKSVESYVDIIEIGTPFIIEEGMRAVRLFRREFPQKEILADVKIMDAGDMEAGSAFEAGANYVTVLGVTDLSTIKACVKTAGQYGKAVVADMICVEDLPARIAKLEESGVHGIAVHTGVDQQKLGITPLDDLRTMKRYCRKAEIFVAGGINLGTLPAYAHLGPDVLIVGGAIGNAADPIEAARLIYSEVRKYNGHGEEVRS